MKYSIAVVFAAAGAAVAQSQCISAALAIPPCGTTALLSLASSYGCGLTDFACQCTHQSEIQASATQPVLKACGAETGLMVQSSALALCSCVSANGGGGSGSGSAPAATSAMATGGSGSGASSAMGSSPAQQTSAAGGAGGATMFTGAAATAGAFAPVGGVLGLLAGVVAYL